MATPKKPSAAGLTQAIGGMLVGVDQQIFRAMPRVEERFKQRDEVSMVASEEGALIVTLPEDTEVPTPSPTEPEPPTP